MSKWLQHRFARWCILNEEYLPDELVRWAYRWYQLN